MMTRMKAHLCKLHDRFDAGFCGINIVGLGSLGKLDCFAYIEEDTNFLDLLLSFFAGYSAYKNHNPSRLILFIKESRGCYATLKLRYLFRNASTLNL